MTIASTPPITEFPDGLTLVADSKPVISQAAPSIAAADRRNQNGNQGANHSSTHSAVSSPATISNPNTTRVESISSWSFSP